VEGGGLLHAGRFNKGPPLRSRRRRSPALTATYSAVRSAMTAKAAFSAAAKAAQRKPLFASARSAPDQNLATGQHVPGTRIAVKWTRSRLTSAVPAKTRSARPSAYEIASAMGMFRSVSTAREPTPTPPPLFEAHGQHEVGHFRAGRLRFTVANAFVRTR